MKDWMIRAIKTFIQAAGSFLIADIAVINNALLDWNTGKHALMTLLVGALAAGICAAWNIINEHLAATK